MLVHLPPVAPILGAHPPDRQQPLVQRPFQAIRHTHPQTLIGPRSIIAVTVRARAAKRDECPGGDQPRHLPHERLLPAALIQRLLEGEALRDVVAAALDPHRLALALG